MSCISTFCNANYEIKKQADGLIICGDEAIGHMNDYDAFVDNKEIIRCYNIKLYYLEEAISFYRGSLECYQILAYNSAKHESKVQQIKQKVNDAESMYLTIFGINEYHKSQGSLNYKIKPSLLPKYTSMLLSTEEFKSSNKYRDLIIGLVVIFLIIIISAIIKKRSNKRIFIDEKLDGLMMKWLYESSSDEINRLESQIAEYRNNGGCK